MSIILMSILFLVVTISNINTIMKVSEVIVAARYTTLMASLCSYFTCGGGTEAVIPSSPPHTPSTNIPH